MSFDNLRRNIWEFEDIIDINLATDGKAILGKSSLISLYRGNINSPYHCH